MEDKHFLIDYVPPLELTYSLISIKNNDGLSNKELSTFIEENFELPTQKNFSSTTRRLLDLGLVEKNNNNEFYITELGNRINEIYHFDYEIFFDLIHYLHNTKYINNPLSRKYFWSYRSLTQYFWNHKELRSDKEMSEIVLADIQEKWPEHFRETKGGNFNPGGVSSWRYWINQLTPEVINQERRLIKRETSRYQLILLSINNLYRSEKIDFGNPILLSANIIDQIASEFFLKNDCVNNLINIAAQFSSALSIGDTFAGKSITLHKPFGIERV